MGFKPKVVQAPAAPEAPIVHPEQEVTDVSGKADSATQQKNKRRMKLSDTTGQANLVGGTSPLRKTLG